MKAKLDGRANNGRPAGSMNKRSKEMIAAAELTGELPHQFLLRIARGELILQKRLDAETGEIEEKLIAPTFGDRVEAAKSVSPYFAAKLVAVDVTKAASDVELDELIREYAARAGVEDSLVGEEETGFDSEPAPSRVRLTAAASRSLTSPTTGGQTP